MPRGTRKSNDEPIRGKKRPSASHTEDYLSDDGFVADGSHDTAPRKKAKTTTAKKSNMQTKGKQSGEEELWELTDKRRVQISEFKGMQMVGIREFYEKDGEMLPGKKGISLTIPQYNALLALLPEIETSLIAKGESVVRPDYTTGKNGAEAGHHGESDGEEGAGDAEGEGGEEEKAEGKKNFEATSEEEEG